jgi:hypothetical protein
MQFADATLTAVEQIVWREDGTLVVFSIAIVNTTLV